MENIPEETTSQPDADASSSSLPLIIGVSLVVLVVLVAVAYLLITSRTSVEPPAPPPVVEEPVEDVVALLSSIEVEEERAVLPRSNEAASTEGSVRIPTFSDLGEPAGAAEMTDNETVLAGEPITIADSLNEPVIETSEPSDGIGVTDITIIDRTEAKSAPTPLVVSGTVFMVEPEASMFMLITQDENYKVSVTDQTKLFINGKQFGLSDLKSADIVTLTGETTIGSDQFTAEQVEVTSVYDVTGSLAI